MSSDKVRLLVVDDEPRVLRGVALHLGELFDLTTAPGGEEAIAILRGAADAGVPFDVLVTDLMMPKMRGNELIARAEVITPTIASIMLTGSFNNTGLAQLASLYRTLEKPCAPRILAQVVDAAVAARGRHTRGDRDETRDETRAEAQGNSGAFR